MVADNFFTSCSGTTLEVGSRAAQVTILCGISGTVAIPVMVNDAGALVTV